MSFKRDLKALSGFSRAGYCPSHPQQKILNYMKNDLHSEKAGLNRGAAENSGSNDNKKTAKLDRRESRTKEPRQRWGSFTKLSIYINNLDYMAERAGFEPAVHLLGAYNRLAGDRFRPLSHLSAFFIQPIFKIRRPLKFSGRVLKFTGGGSRIRTREPFGQRFSRPPPSTSRPSLHA